MTKAKTETREQREKRNERNRQRRQAATAAKVMERAAAATGKAVEAPKQPTATGKATKAPKTQPGATRAPTLAQRAAAVGFKVGVNRYLIDLEGVEFFPFYPDDLLSSQAMLHNDAAIRGRAVGALDTLAEFLASRVTGRAPSRTEMKLAALIEGLAYELLAVADEIPKILDRLDGLRRERDALKKEKAEVIDQLRRWDGKYIRVQVKK